MELISINIHSSRKCSKNYPAKDVSFQDVQFILAKLFSFQGVIQGRQVDYQTRKGGWEIQLAYWGFSDNDLEGTS